MIAEANYQERKWCASNQIYSAMVVANVDIFVDQWQLTEANLIEHQMYLTRIHWPVDGGQLRVQCFIGTSPGRTMLCSFFVLAICLPLFRNKYYSKDHTMTYVVWGDKSRIQLAQPEIAAESKDTSKIASASQEMWLANMLF